MRRPRHGTTQSGREVPATIDAERRAVKEGRRRPRDDVRPSRRSRPAARRAARRRSGRRRGRRRSRAGGGRARGRGRAAPRRSRTRRSRPGRRGAAARTSSRRRRVPGRASGIAEGEDGADPRVARGDAQGHGRAEGEAAEDERQPGEAVLHLDERRPRVLLLAGAVVVDALAPADAAEVEAQDGEPGRLQRLRGAEDDLEVHHPAVERVRVADDRRRRRAAPPGSIRIASRRPAGPRKSKVSFDATVAASGDRLRGRSAGGTTSRRG